MATEIERKFLVADDGWRPAVTGHIDIRQAYLAVSDVNTVRVRTHGDMAFLTIKSADSGMTRQEFEFPIPVADAEGLLALRSGHIIEKRRHIVPAGDLPGDLPGDLRWEIDVFAGDLAGLIIAEIELPSEATEFTRPSWLGREVTGDARYSNAQLAMRGPAAAPQS